MKESNKKLRKNIPGRGNSIAMYRNIKHVKSDNAGQFYFALK